MPFNSFNSFSPNSWQQYINPTMYNTPSVFTTGINYTPPSIDYTNTYNNYGLNNTWQTNFNGPNFDTFNWTLKPTQNKKSNNDKKPSIKKESKSLQIDLANKAKSYLGKVNSDAEGNRLFSPNAANQAWCADFVTYVTKDTFGSSLPSDFGSSSVSELRTWAENKNCYLSIPTSNKADFIKKNVKVGDIMIEKNDGKSHTGIVTKVNSDGSFETVEGNCSNKVATKTYSADSTTLSGFISLEKYA